jgi:hypothetical protein
LAFWRHPVGTLALYGALATHVTLALWSVYRRRHIRMPAWEAAQLLLGLLIPPLLVTHLVRHATGARVVRHDGFLYPRHPGALGAAA